MSDVICPTCRVERFAFGDALNELCRAAGRIRELSEENDRLRAALRSLGYHAPGDCPHGTVFWAGDHCVFDEPLLSVPVPGPSRPYIAPELSP